MTSLFDLLVATSLALPSAGRAATCLRYAPDTVHLTGTLARMMFYGAPGFGEDPQHDEQEIGFYISLRTPICTATGRGDEAKDGVYLVQLVLDSAGYARLRPSLGKSVTVRGTLSAAASGHHHAPLLLTVAPRDASAREASLALNDLATAWSGGDAAPTCRDFPSMAEFPPEFRMRNCEWPRLTRGREFGQVTGTQGPGGVLHAISWERAVTDSNVAARLADSVGAVLRASGLIEYACPDAGRRWQRPGVTVQYTRGVVHDDGLLRVLIFVTTVPNVIPEFACPAAPKLPNPPPTNRRADGSSTLKRMNKG
jgi:hypothetical protein